jgi:hypothetical protein
MRLTRWCAILFCIQVSALHAQQQSITSVDVVSEAFAGEEQGPIKCGTGAILGWRTRESVLKSSRILERPTLPQEYVTGDNRFRFHYTTTGGDAVDPTSTNGLDIPDYVYEAGLAAIYSHRLLVDTLGYRAPASDGGNAGPEFDFYILDLSNGLYGYTDPDGNVPGSVSRASAYVVIDNNFLPNEGYNTFGLDAMRVTVAHEYFHAVQFNYGYRLEDEYFFETSSVWFEDVAYTDVNDYLAYLPPYFRNVSQPLYLRNNQHEYGNGIWLTFLVKKFDIGIVRQVWDLIEEMPTLEGTSQVLNGRGDTFGAAYAEFATWLYFTKHRVDPINYFPEGAAYPLVRIGRTETLRPQGSISISDSLQNLASRFFRFDSLKQAHTVSHVSNAQPGRWRFATITGDRFVGYDIQQSGSAVPIVATPAGPVDTLVAIVSNTSLTTLESSFKYSLQVSSGSAPGKTLMLPPGPNPFLPASGENLTLRVILDSSSEVDVFVLAEDGRAVRKIHRGIRSAGVEEIFWDGRDDGGEIVASGIYIVQVIAGGFQESAKVAVIHP